MSADPDFASIMSLMAIQNIRIFAAYSKIYALANDPSIGYNNQFREFSLNFIQYVRYHSGSEGFGRAIDAAQTNHPALFEKMLDGEVVAAAERLEFAISNLELFVRELRFLRNPDVMALYQEITAIEENQLKIIEILHEIVSHRSQTNLLN